MDEPHHRKKFDVKFLQVWGHKFTKLLWKKLNSLGEDNLTFTAQILVAVNT